MWLELQQSVSKIQDLFPVLFQLCVAVIQPILHMNNGTNSVFVELLSSLFWSIGSIVHCGIVGSRSIHRGIPVYSRQLFHLLLKDTRFYHRKTKKTRAPCLYYPNSSASRQLLLRGGDVSVNPGPSTKEGGGVFIAVKDNLDCRRRSDLETGLEMLCVELNLACSSKIVISAIYRPPDSTPSYDFHSVMEFTSHLNNSARLVKNHSLILRDFNYPAIKWIEGCGFSNSTNSADSAVCETLQDHSLLH